MHLTKFGQNPIKHIHVEEEANCEKKEEEETIPES